MKKSGMSKPKKQIPKKKVYLELLPQRLGQRSKRSLLDGDTVNFWQYTEIRVDPDLFFTSFQISTIKGLDQIHL